jgi:hypothetical protein
MHKNGLEAFSEGVLAITVTTWCWSGRFHTVWTSRIFDRLPRTFRATC